MASRPQGDEHTGRGPGTTVTMLVSGGGGYGDPFERERGSGAPGCQGGIRLS